MKTLAKVGIGCAGVAAAASVGLALLAPTLVREAGHFLGPSRDEAPSDGARCHGRRRRLEASERDALTAAQLDRFFTVRTRVEAARRSAGPSLDTLPSKDVDSLEELRQVPEIIRGVSGVVGAEMDALLAVRMPPAEYHWIALPVIERWRGELQKAGRYPIAVHAAAGEVAAVAADETDARVRARLERLVAAMKARRPAAPEGFDPGIHELLLSRLDEVERHSLDDVVEPYVPIRLAARSAGWAARHGLALDRSEKPHRRPFAEQPERRVSAGEASGASAVAEGARERAADRRRRPRGPRGGERRLCLLAPLDAVVAPVDDDARAPAPHGRVGVLVPAQAVEPGAWAS